MSIITKIRYHMKLFNIIILIDFKLIHKDKIYTHIYLLIQILIIVITII